MKTKITTASVLLLSLTACFGSKNTIAPTPSPSALDVMNTQGKLLEKVKPSDSPFQIFRLLSSSPMNVNFSPLSMKMAFALIYPGTANGTQSLFEQLFSFKPSVFNPFKAEFDLANTIQNLKDESQQLSIANSVWVKDEKSVVPEYRNNIKDQAAEVFKLNADALNHWVAKETQGKITKLVDKLDPETFSIFVNAIYFKQKWAHPFEKKGTSTENFQVESSFAINVEMMHQKTNFNYFEDQSSQWIELPYQNDSLVMRVALPKKRFDLKAIENNLTSEYLAQVEAQSKPTRIALSLPKFKFDQKLSIKKIMSDAGYESLFNKGDYSKLFKNKALRISDVIQASAIEVNELGTEAAAATAVVMARAMLELGTSTDFKADQPFVFVLQNKTTKEIYFLGKVFNPRGETPSIQQKK